MPLIHASPLPCTAARIAGGALVGLEAEEHLVEHDLVQHLGAGRSASRAREPRGEVAAALDELGDPAAAELADRRVDREAAGAA